MHSLEIASSVAVLGLLVSSCTFTDSTIVASKSHNVSNSTDEPIAIDLKDVNQSCHRRDLTIPWSQRKYWCQQQNNSISKKPYRNLYSNHIVTQPIASKLSKPAIKRNPAFVNFQATQSVFKPLEPSVKKVKASVEKPVLSFAKLAQAASRLPSSIVFAKNLSVLGPQGRQQSSNLVEIVKQAESVKLRGLFLPEEVIIDSDTYREILSVGRALAVRKHWKAQGVDTSNIKILHHDPELYGRSVEVYIND